MNIFPKHISDKECICKMYRALTIKQEHKDLNLLKLDKRFKDTSPKERKRCQNKHMKKVFKIVSCQEDRTLNYNEALFYVHQKAKVNKNESNDIKQDVKYKVLLQNQNQ